MDSPSWEKITSDHYVLEAIKGYRMKFTAHPQQSHSPTTVTVESGEHARAISEEVRKMVEKGAVTEVKSQTEEGFVSRLFLVPIEVVINQEPIKRLQVYDRSHLPVLDGGCPGGERHPSSQRLDDKDRP